MDLTQKVGPFPAYVWGAGIGLALVGAMYWQSMQKSDSEPATGTATETDAPSSFAQDAIDGVFGTGDTTSGGSNTGGVPAAESIDTNEAWLFRAVAYLVGKGKNPLTAQRALWKYLNGETMSADDEALANEVIRGMGAPPETVEVGPATPPPPVDQTPVYTRAANGTITKTVAGNASTVSESAYVAAGMPPFAANAYATKSYKIVKTHSISALAARAHTTVNNIKIINRWTKTPSLHGGMTVKVPA